MHTPCDTFAYNARWLKHHVNDKRIRNLSLGVSIMPSNRDATYQARFGWSGVKRRTLDIIFYRTYAELKSEAQRTYAGVLWWIIEPVLFMLIFYLVFGVLFQRGTEDFVPFLLIGLALWHWFQATVMQCAGAITTNRGLIQQVYVPNYVFPTVVILANILEDIFCRDDSPGPH